MESKGEGLGSDEDWGGMEEYQSYQLPRIIYDDNTPEGDHMGLSVTFYTETTKKQAKKGTHTARTKEILDRCKPQSVIDAAELLGDSEDSGAITFDEAKERLADFIWKNRTSHSLIKNYVPVPAAILAQRDAAMSPTPENAAEEKVESVSITNSPPAPDNGNTAMQKKLLTMQYDKLVLQQKSKKDELTVNESLSKCFDGKSAALKLLVHMIVMNKSLRLRFFSNLTMQEANEIVIIGVQRYTEKNLSAVLKNAVQIKTQGEFIQAFHTFLEVLAQVIDMCRISDRADEETLQSAMRYREQWKSIFNTCLDGSFTMQGQMPTSDIVRMIDKTMVAASSPFGGEEPAAAFKSDVVAAIKTQSFADIAARSAGAGRARRGRQRSTSPNTRRRRSSSRSRSRRRTRSRRGRGDEYRPKRGRSRDRARSRERRPRRRDEGSRSRDLGAPPCKFFRSRRGCAKGDRCNFQH
jgi:hypothetical protein